MSMLRNRNKLALAIILAMTLGAVWLPAAPALAAPDCTAFTGAGTQADPYIVDDAATLDAIRHCQQAGTYFKLTDDISLDGVDWEPIADFAGVLDGGGHTIRNLTVDAVLDEPAGLFANTAPTAIVRNMTLKDVAVTGKHSTGAVAGRNSGEIREVHVTNGTVTGSGENVGGLVGLNSGAIWYASAAVSVSGSTYVGGLVGLNWEGQTVVQCSQFTGSRVSGTYGVGGLIGYAGGQVNSSWADTNVTGDNVVGGLVGGLHLGQINEGYALGTVTSKAYTGGLIGWTGQENAAVRTYAAATVSGPDGQSGGFAGNMPFHLSHSYWHKDVAGQAHGIGGAATDPAGLTALASADMTKRASFVGWDFDDIWDIDDGASYPYLRCSLPARPPAPPAKPDRPPPPPPPPAGERPGGDAADRDPDSDRDRDFEPPGDPPDDPGSDPPGDLPTDPADPSTAVPQPPPAAAPDLPRTGGNYIWLTIGGGALASLGGMLLWRRPARSRQ